MGGAVASLDGSAASPDGGGGSCEPVATTKAARPLAYSILPPLRAVVLGQTEHGTKADGPFDRTTGKGWVREERVLTFVATCTLGMCELA